MKTIAAIAAALFVSLATSASIPDLRWSLERGAEISGSTLVVDLLDGSTNRAFGMTSVDVSDCLGEDSGARFDFRVRAQDVSEPAADHNGVKVMLIYTTDTGSTLYPQCYLPRGTFGWTNCSLHVNWLRGVPADGRLTIALGLQGSTGRAEFDLSALSLSAEPLGLERTNQNYVVRYPSAEGGTGEAFQRPLRGFNTANRILTEADMRDMRALGATLLRFQMTRSGKNDDLDEYAAWVDSRLDNLVDVLGWAGELGMKVCVDLHVVPGGQDNMAEQNLFHDQTWLDAYIATWERIARRCVAAQTSGLYGYDLINEPYQISPAAVASYWEVQRRAAEAIRAIDPYTPIIVESNGKDGASAFSYLSPLAMDNVIYQVHVYAPSAYTHQGSNGRAALPDVRWPDASRGWDADYLRQVLEPVREFQARHKCRIFVGEFSAVAWANGAENWLRDSIDLFEEYGWDWAYHAFREWRGWDLDYAGTTPDAATLRYAPDNPRKRVVADSMLLAPDTPWFSAAFSNGVASAVGGVWSEFAGGDGEFAALRGREGVVRLATVVEPQCGVLPSKLTGLLASAVARGQLASTAFVEEDDGSLSLRCLVAEDGQAKWLPLEGFSLHAAEAYQDGPIVLVVAEVACTGGVARVRYAATKTGASGATSALCRLRSATGETWFDSPCGQGGSPGLVAGRVAVSEPRALSSLTGIASGGTDNSPALAFGAIGEGTAPDGSGGTVCVEVLDAAPGIPSSARLRLTLSEADSGTGQTLAFIDQPFTGDGTYRFDTAGVLDAAALAGGTYYPYEISLVDAAGAKIQEAPSHGGTLRIAADVPWFSADAATGAVKGGAWVSGGAGGPPAVASGAWQITPDRDATFQARSPRGGCPRVEMALSPCGGHLPSKLSNLLAVSVARGDRAALVTVEEYDGSLSLRGLALVDGEPAWVALGGGASSPNEPLRFAVEFDLSGTTPMVSYLASSGSSQGGVSSPSEPLVRLRSPSGETCLPAPGFAARPEVAPYRLAGGVRISGCAGVSSLIGTTSVPAAGIPPDPVTLFIIH